MPQVTPAKENKELTLGKIASPFGVRGWTKVVSYTDPAVGLLEYPKWTVQQSGREQVFTVVEGRQHGKFLVAKFEGIDDRDEVAKLTNALVVVDRSELPSADDSYYWADLIGLEVISDQGQSFGKVDRLLETGANDVLVVNGERERLIPWITDSVVVSVDLKAKTIVVNWDADF